jgi:hypothetical protein
LPGERRSADRRSLLTLILRRGEMSTEELAAHTGMDVLSLRPLLEELEAEGVLHRIETGGKTLYRARLAPKRGRQLSPQIMQALGEPGDETAPAPVLQAGRARRALDALLTNRGRFFLGIAPVAFTFLLVEGLILAQAESFTDTLNFAGVLIVSLLGGIFPVLLLVSSRRKGELVPGSSYRMLSHPLLLAGIYMLNLAGIFLHGLVIWQNPVQRIVALSVGVLMLAITVSIVRRGAFVPRAVVELREDWSQPGQAHLTVVSGGQPAAVQVRCEYREDEPSVQAAGGAIPAFDRLNRVVAQLPANSARELKVWAHRVSPEGRSESLPAAVEVGCAGETVQADLRLADGQALFPLGPGDCQVEIRLEEI